MDIGSFTGIEDQKSDRHGSSRSGHHGKDRIQTYCFLENLLFVASKALLLGYKTSSERQPTTDNNELENEADTKEDMANNTF